MSKGQEADGGRPEAAAAPAAQTPWQAGSGSSPSPARPAALPLGLGGLGAAFRGLRPWGGAQVPAWLFQPFCSGSSFKCQLLREASCLCTKNLPPARSSRHRPSYWFSLPQSIYPHWKLSYRMGSLHITRLPSGMQTPRRGGQAQIYRSSASGPGTLPGLLPGVPRPLQWTAAVVLAQHPCLGGGAHNIHLGNRPAPTPSLCGLGGAYLAPGVERPPGPS